jgi:DNA sulfur modification protein DndB
MKLHHGDDNMTNQQQVIENVLLSKMRGKVTYLGNLAASTAMQLTYVKPFDHPSGKGYQRPVDSKRCNDFAQYLSKGDNSLFTPILLNAESRWDFIPYDRARPAYGRLLCKDKASLMDGQHRLGGVKRYTQDTNSDINVPFLAFHFLDEDEEVQLFDTINTKQKGIGASLSRYLSRDTDEISWISTQLITRSDSPFHNIGTITGKRNAGRHVTLQNLYKILEFLFKNVNGASREEKLMLALVYFNSVKELFNKEWLDYSEYRITHIVCLNALAIAGADVLQMATNNEKKQIDYNKIVRKIKKMNKMDWSITGPLKYIKGINGSKALASDLKIYFLEEH